MNQSLTNRSAAIRDYLGKLDPPIDRTLVVNYSRTAARWEAYRLLIDRGQGTPADEQRFRELSDILRDLTERIGLLTCTEENKLAGGLPGLTDWNGFLPRSPSRIVCSSWQEAADGWGERADCASARRGTRRCRGYRAGRCAGVLPSFSRHRPGRLPACWGRPTVQPGGHRVG